MSRHQYNNTHSHITNKIKFASYNAHKTLTNAHKLPSKNAQTTQHQTLTQTLFQAFAYLRIEKEAETSMKKHPTDKCTHATGHSITHILRSLPIPQGC